MLIVTAIVSLLGMAVIRSSQSGPPAKPMTASQKLSALEKVEPDSPEMAKFLQREKAAQEANEQAARDLPGK